MVEEKDTLEETEVLDEPDELGEPELEGLEEEGVEEELDVLREENLRLRREMDELRFTEPENEEEIEAERKKLLDELTRVRQERDKLHLEQVRQQVLKIYPLAPAELVTGNSKGELLKSAKKATLKFEALRAKIRTEERTKLEKELGKPVPIAPEVPIAEATLAKEKEREEYEELRQKGRGTDAMAEAITRKTLMEMRKSKK